MSVLRSVALATLLAGIILALAACEGGGDAPVYPVTVQSDADTAALVQQVDTLEMPAAGVPADGARVIVSLRDRIQPEFNFDANVRKLTYPERVRAPLRTTPGQESVQINSRVALRRNRRGGAGAGTPGAVVPSSTADGDTVWGHQARRSNFKEATTCQNNRLEDKWWRRGGSNSRPSHCERDALPAELRPHEDRNYSRNGASP